MHLGFVFAYKKSGLIERENLEERTTHEHNHPGGYEEPPQT